MSIKGKYAHVYLDDNGCVHDGRGHHFCSMKDMLNQYRIDHHTFYDRIDAGMSLSQALTVGRNKDIRIIDTALYVLGSWYTNESAVAKHYGVTPTTVKTHIEHIDDYLRKKLKRSPVVNTCFSSGDLMTVCNVSDVTLGSRLRAGWDIQSAMSQPVSRSGKTTPCVDHLGNTYPSITGMVSHYNISMALYYSRKELGWNLERILTTPVGKRSRKTAAKILGGTYK